MQFNLAGNDNRNIIRPTNIRPSKVLHTFGMFVKQNIRTNFSPNGSPLTTLFQTLYSPQCSMTARVNKPSVNKHTKYKIQ